MANRARLIVNADDFGLGAGINRGIIRAHEQGIVTSASFMVRHGGAVDAASYSRAHAALDLGLHVDLGEWIYRHDTWMPVYTVVPADDAGAVRAEVGRQLEAFRRLLDRDPTHLDTHQHVHQREPAKTVLYEVASTLGVPLRHRSDVTYCGRFYGQSTSGEALPSAITPAALIDVFASLAPGVTELACHPGYVVDLETMYAVEREAEVDTLCHPDVRTALAALEIELTSFGAILVGHTA